MYNLKMWNASRLSSIHRGHSNPLCISDLTSFLKNDSQSNSKIHFTYILLFLPFEEAEF